ncbi:MAG: hypothetical protein H6737_09125 [Alphaproteobacteria bacterium]|nr:hypothetical protein [Alphaproteobacteria bacterium]
MEPIRHKPEIAALGALLVVLGLAPIAALPLLPSCGRLVIAAALVVQIAAARCFAAMGPGPRGHPRLPTDAVPTIDGWSLRLSGFGRPRFLKMTVVAYALLSVVPATWVKWEWARVPSPQSCGNAYDTARLATWLFVTWTVLWLVGWLAVHAAASRPVTVRLRGRVLDVGRRTLILDGRHTLDLGPTHETLGIRTPDGQAELHAHADRIAWVHRALAAVPTRGGRGDVPPSLRRKRGRTTSCRRCGCGCGRCRRRSCR